MANGDVVIGGVALSADVARRLEMAGMGSREVANDVEALRSGLSTRQQLLAHCVDGCEDATSEVEWAEYVSAVCAIVDRAD